MTSIIVLIIILSIFIQHVLKSKKYRPNFSLESFIENNCLTVDVFSFDGYYEDILDIHNLGLFNGIMTPTEFKLRFHLKSIANYRLDFTQINSNEFIALTKNFQDYYCVFKKSSSQRSTKDRCYKYYIMFNENSCIQKRIFEEDYLNEINDLILSEINHNNTIVLQLKKSFAS